MDNMESNRNIFNLLMNSPITWVALSVIIILYFLISYFYPKKVEFITCLMELFLGFFIYIITFSWLTDTKSFSEKIQSYLMLIIVIITAFFFIRQ